jgi:hypothetical protein
MSFVRHHAKAHPAAPWTLQQFREGLPGDHACRRVIHDRDRIYSKDLDKVVEAMGGRVLPTPVRAPQRNAYCRRMVRAARRACLDFLIRFSAGGEARPDGRPEHLRASPLVRAPPQGWPKSTSGGGQQPLRVLTGHFFSITWRWFWHGYRRA